MGFFFRAWKTVYSRSEDFDFQHVQRILHPRNLNNYPKWWPGIGQLPFKNRNDLVSMLSKHDGWFIMPRNLHAKQTRNWPDISAVRSVASELKVDQHQILLNLELNVKTCSIHGLVTLRWLLRHMRPSNFHKTEPRFLVLDRPPRLPNMVEWFEQMGLRDGHSMLMYLQSCQEMPLHRCTIPSLHVSLSLASPSCPAATFNTSWLVVSTPLKNISQIGSCPQVKMKIKNIWNHHLVYHISPI